MTRKLQLAVVLGATLLAAQAGFANNSKIEAGAGRIENQVRHELVSLPYYSLFDHFTFRVEDGTVTLMGKVSQPLLKSDAEKAVKKIEGVENVVNQLEVLPLSANDDRLRHDLYYSIYGHSVLQTLSMRSVPPIHIIVENGHVTLEGVVANEMQRSIARMQANGVPGVFTVTNNLRLESES